MLGLIQKFAGRVWNALPSFNGFFLNKIPKNPLMTQVTDFSSEFQLSMLSREENVKLPPDLKRSTERISNLVTTNTYFPASEEFLKLENEILTSITKQQKGINYQINFNEDILRKSFKNFIESRLEIYQQEIKEIDFDEIEAKEKYMAIVEKFLQDGLKLIEQTSNLIFTRLLKGELEANDLDSAKAFCVIKNLTSTCAKDLFGISTKLIFDFNQETKIQQKSSLKALLSERLKKKLKTLHFISYFGCQNKNLFESFKESLHEKDLKTVDVNDLLIFRIFHQAICGTLQIDNNLECKKTNMLDSSVIIETVDQLCLNIVTSTEQKNSLDNKMNDQRIFLAKCAKDEIDTNRKIQNMATDKISRLLEIDFSNDPLIHEISQNPINDFLGSFSKETLGNKVTVEEKITANILWDPDYFQRHFVRVVLETALLTGFNEILAFNDGEVTQSIKSPIDDSSGSLKNFQNLPWLNTFKEKMLQRSKQEAEKDSILKRPLNLTEYIVGLTKVLHQNDLFKFANFIKRYNLEASADKLLKQLGKLTDVKSMYVVLNLYAHLFTDHLDHMGFDVTANELSTMKELINYLLHLSTFKDEEGNLIVNIDDEKIQKVKFDEITAKFAGPGSLAQNTDLICKFFANKPNVISTAMFYYLTKFLTDESQDPHSLGSRLKILQTIFSSIPSLQDQVPWSMRAKLFDQILGIETIESKSRQRALYERKGLIRAFCLDLGTKLKQYINGQPCSVKLLPLLNFYHQLENTVKNKPDLFSECQEIHHKIYNEKNELLPSLKQQLKLLLPNNTPTCIDFVSRLGDSQMKRELSLDLIKIAAGYGQKILTHNISDNVLKIRDSEEETIHNVTNFLEILNAAGILFPTKNRQNYTILNISEAERNNDKDLDRALETVENCLSKSVLLISTNRNRSTEVFPDQFTKKNILLTLLTNYGYQPAPGYYGLAWIDEKKLRTVVPERIAA